MKRFFLHVAALVLAIGLLHGPAQAQTNARGLDQTAVARQFPRHEGSTVLWVNFDGWRDQDHRVRAFQTTTGNRDRDIQDILFRTSQIFTPFDVTVRRAFNNGGRSTRNGDTTVFVGGNEENVDKKGNKFAYASTPWENTDYPRNGTNRRPNSHAFDVAFVDPMGKGNNGGWANTNDNGEISQSIAHEAGHTFGLAHVRSKPIPDVMSYDADNGYFANRTLWITDLNNSGTVTEHDPDQVPRWTAAKPGGGSAVYPIVTQNSYTYLTAVLGARDADGWAHVADRTAVDPGFRDGKLAELQLGYHIDGAMRRQGDYNVFQFKAATDQAVNLQLERTAQSTLDPILLVYDAAGKRLVGYRGTAGIINFKPKAGSTYKLVVGARDGVTKGGYRLTISMATK
jgi:hypothetical protein